MDALHVARAVVSPPHNWPYVAVGYGLCAGVLGGYVAWVVAKLRRVERTDDGA